MDTGLVVKDDMFTAAECAGILSKCQFSAVHTNKFGRTYTNSENRTDECAVLDFDSDDIRRHFIGLLREMLPDTIAFNPRVRVARLGPGAFIRRHQDSQMRDYTYTVLVYLQAPESGGETRFFGSPRAVTEVAPVVGRMVVFPRDLDHESVEVTAGVKCSMRTDVAVRRADYRPDPDFPWHDDWREEHGENVED